MLRVYMKTKSTAIVAPYKPPVMKTGIYSTTARGEHMTFDEKEKHKTTSPSTSWKSLQQVYKGFPMPTIATSYSNIPPNYLWKSIKYIGKKKPKSVRDNSETVLIEHPDLKLGGSMEAYHWYQSEQRKQWNKRKIYGVSTKNTKKTKKKKTKNNTRKNFRITNEQEQHLLELQETRWNLQAILDVLPKPKERKDRTSPDRLSGTLSVTGSSPLITGSVTAEKEITDNKNEGQTVNVMIPRLIEVRSINPLIQDRNDNDTESCCSNDSNLIDEDCLARNDIDILDLYKDYTFKQDRKHFSKRESEIKETHTKT